MSEKSSRFFRKLTEKYLLEWLQEDEVLLKEFLSLKKSLIDPPPIFLNRLNNKLFIPFVYGRIIERMDDESSIYKEPSNEVMMKEFILDYFARNEEWKFNNKDFIAYSRRIKDEEIKEFISGFSSDGLILFFGWRDHPDCLDFLETLNNPFELIRDIFLFNFNKEESFIRRFESFIEWDAFSLRVNTHRGHNEVKIEDLILKNKKDINFGYVTDLSSFSEDAIISLGADAINKCTRLPITASTRLATFVKSKLYLGVFTDRFLYKTHFEGINLEETNKVGDVIRINEEEK